MAKLERCRHCGTEIPGGNAAAIHGDHNRLYCSEACARAQLDAEQGASSPTSRGAEWDSARDGDRAGDRVGPNGRSAVPRNGPTTR